MAAPPSPEAESAVALALAGRSPVRCGWCGEPFVGHPNRRYCSRPCENRADYARHAEARRAECRERYRRGRDARPAGPLAPRPLSPSELAAIASAPPTVPTVELARRLGLEDRSGNVSAARRRIRAAGGWFSALGLRPCTECGLPVARPKKTAHPGCERARDRRRERERRPARPVGRPARRRRARVSPADEREAPRRGVRWSPRQDRRLLDSPDAPARDLARALGRTTSAVRKRRRRLRGRPAPGADPVARLPRSLAYRLGLLPAPPLGDAGSPSRRGSDRSAAGATKAPAGRAG